MSGDSGKLRLIGGGDDQDGSSAKYTEQEINSPMDSISDLHHQEPECPGILSLMTPYGSSSFFSLSIKLIYN